MNDSGVAATTSYVRELSINHSNSHDKPKATPTQANSKESHRRQETTSNSGEMFIYFVLN